MIYPVDREEPGKMKSPRIPLFAGAAAGIGASVCCVGPLVLVSLGIGGAWVASLTKWEPLRPYFLVLTALLLGLAFRQLYLTPPVCEPGQTCADPAVRKRQRIIFWLVAIPVLALISFPWYAPLFF